MGMLITITDAGRAALVTPGHDGTNAHRVTAIGLATAPFAPAKDLKELPHEHKRITTFGGVNVAPDTIHVTLQDDSAEQYPLYGLGLYLENGVLAAVYGQATPILEKSPAAILLLSVDIQFATIDAAQLVFGDTTFVNPPATTERAGVVKLATQAEVDAGEDDTRAVTPRTAAQRYAALTGARFTGDVHLDGADVVLDGPAERFRGVACKTAGRMRWFFGIDNAPERGGGRGSDLKLISFTDDGEWAGGVMAISREHGTVHLVKRPSFDGHLAWDAGNFDPAEYLPLAGGVLRGDVRFEPGKRLAIGAPLLGALKAALQVNGGIAIDRYSDERSGRLLLGPNDGYLFGDDKSVGFYSPSYGSFQYLFADRTFRIDGKIAWHAGNVTPLDQKKGGTLAGDLAFAPGKRLKLAPGSASAPSLTFERDGALDTGLYHTADGQFGVSCNGAAVVRFAPTQTTFERPVTAPTPAAGDRSTRVATTEWVLAALGTTAIGQIVFEPRTTVRAGFLKANGAVLKRADYPALWAYAQASGALVADDVWHDGRWGCFSSGDGATTFRLPELRGEFIRCWSDDRSDTDPQRMIGSFQRDQNRHHKHDAYSSESGEHVHPAWTDAQGQHGHVVHDPGHGHGVRMGRVGVVATSYGQGWGPYNWDRQDVHGTEAAATNIGIGDAGNHGHNVGIGGAGRHVHTITVNGDGGNEARPRNVALLAMIRAY
ncbi:phage tail protein [Burkholderia sp. Nafp2/4-1b]|nr:phage tail protein [Burkholderia sp. Nafp2/4-1b]